MVGSTARELLHFAVGKGRCALAFWGKPGALPTRLGTDWAGNRGRLRLGGAVARRARGGAGPGRRLVGEQPQRREMQLRRDARRRSRGGAPLRGAAGWGGGVGRPPGAGLAGSDLGAPPGGGGAVAVIRELLPLRREQSFGACLPRVRALVPAILRLAKRGGRRRQADPATVLWWQ